MTADLKIVVIGDDEGEPSGFDSVIGVVPEGWYGTVAGERVFLLQVATGELKRILMAEAARMRERVHHADWVITSDPEQVTTLGIMHDCARCRAGVDQAHAMLRDHPDLELAVGQVWWA